MKEASPVKYYFAKYFFLAFGLLQWLSAVLLFINKNIAGAFVFLVIGLVAVSGYSMIAPKLKRVALGKNRIAVTSNGETMHYEWPEVKWIRALPFVSVYRLKLRGKKERIYFLPRHQDIPLFGIHSEEPALPGSVKKKLK